MFKPTQPDEIVIGFSTASGKFNIIAALIRFFEKTPYSHVYLRYFANSIERDMIYQANIDNLNFTNQQQFLEADNIIVEYAFKVTPEVKKAVIQQCIDRLHLSYGHLQLIGMALCQIWEDWTGKWINNPWHDGTKTQVCSEVAGYALIAMGFQLDPTILEVQGPKWLHNQIETWLTEGKCRKL